MRRAATATLLTAAALTSVGAVHSAFTATAGAPSSFDAAAVFAPRLVAPPRITGTALEGETLTAEPATWARAVDARSGTWWSCASACTKVGDGTALRLARAHVGARIEYRETATNAGGSTTGTSARTGPVAMRPPANQIPPAIGGSLAVGDTVTALPGTWSGEPAFAYRWLRCAAATCTPIPNETDPDHLITGDDANATLRVEVTGTNAGGQATATSAPTAPIGRASFTHVLCRNPDDGKLVGLDGQLPDGLAFDRNTPNFPNPGPQTRCATTNAGIPLTTGGTWTASSPNQGGWVEYRGGPDLEFAGASLYRQGQMSGLFSWNVNTSTGMSIFALPQAEICSWGYGCITRGTASSPFDDANRVDIARGPANGFNVVLLCDIPAGRICTADGTQTVRLYGAKITLRDTSTPKVTNTPTGGLVTDATFQGTEDLAFTATDTGAGLYRVRIRIGAQEVAAQRLHTNGGRCADVNAANGDAYEFAYRQPCPSSLSASLQFDTEGWPRTGRLRILLEDAGRNTTMIVDRNL